MTLEQLIAEITSGGMQQYDEANLIDYISVRSWIKAELKRFGNNIMVMGEELVHIKNYKGKLPDNFWQLYLAVNCNLKGYIKDDPENVLQNSFAFLEKIETTQEWDNQNETYYGKDVKYVREDFYFNTGKATFFYGNPTFLKLKRGFDKSLCAPECKNLIKSLTHGNPNEVNIVGDTLNTNFKEGSIYLQYRGLPTDEEGNLIIPTTQHDRLKDYLIYYCRMRILEDIWTGDDADVAQKLSYYSTRQREAFQLAMTETKFEGLGRNWATLLRNKQRAQTRKYDIMLPKV